MTIEEPSSKHLKYESENFILMEDDDRHVRYPHNDPLVITIQIANVRIHYAYSGNMTEGVLFNTYYSSGLFRLTKKI